VSGNDAQAFLKTERLTLRRFTPDDVESLVELDGDPEVMRYISGGRATSREEIERRELPAFLAYYTRSDGYGFWAAVEKATGEFVGWFHLRPRDDGAADEPELGYRLRRSAWGKGYATEGSRALIEKAFTDLGAQRVWAETMVVHTASHRVMEKAGLKYVRTFHADWPVKIEGDEEGDVEYALTRAEWEEERGRLDLVRVAARNNAEWCDAFCGTHGITGRFDEDAWWSAERTPPFYPDAVTLVPGVDADSILARIDARAGCSIKDSFGDLDLAADGFDVLFRAEWLRLQPARPLAPTGWSSIETPEELRRWETAWGGGPEAQPFFRPALLAEGSVLLLAHFDRDRIIGGAVANRSATAIGVSNVFAEGGDLEAAYLGAATAAQERWGSLPVVGYDSGAELEAARRAGFVGTGELTVWIRAT
jgi:RimJ/RimL family protein N-acetyltransferase